MKKIISINLGNFGSTGKVVKGIHKVAEKKKMLTYFAYSGNRLNKEKEDTDICIINLPLRKITEILEQVTGLLGHFSVISTLLFILKIRRINPDIIHLHNLHSTAINLPMLFCYIKKSGIRTIWTLHDCWAFTGHCANFEMCGCKKWETKCKACEQYKRYPKSLVDNSAYMYEQKRKWFGGIENLQIVTPSIWLSEMVKKSFLSEYPVKVINNGISLDIFGPDKNEYQTKVTIGNKKFVLLGVAFSWSDAKGLDVFIELAKSLPDQYQIVLVGTNREIDKLLPQNIISIHSTYDQSELAAIYAHADLFLNPTREDNFPTVNMEALACGTPVLTFDTGGSAEILDSRCGSVVSKDDLNAFKSEIIRICTTKPYSSKDCIERSQKFDINERFNEYIELYLEMNYE